MKIDLVYKIGINAEWDEYNELKYSIRSAVKYFSDLRNIVIVGNKPHWASDKIIHIPAKDPYTHNKDANLINKMILACLDERISDEFINISDDQFFLSNVTYNDFKTNYIENNHYNCCSNGKMNRWEIRLNRTKQLLESKSLTYNCYETHIPCLLNKNLYPKTLLQYDFGVDVGYCGNTLYFNSILDKPKVVTKNILTRITNKHNLDDLIKAVENSRFLNYTNKSINDDLKFYLLNKFNTKSIYEL